jgi:hypothetical protein
MEALLPMAPESMQVARAARTVQPCAVEGFRPVSDEGEAALLSTISQRFETAEPSLQQNQSASGTRRVVPRSQRVVVAVSAAGALVAAATIALWSRNPVATPTRAPAVAAAQNLPSALEPEPIRALPVLAPPAETNQPKARPSAAPRRPVVTSNHPRISAPPAADAKALAVTPATSSVRFDRSRMGGRL